jgi:hypothetical protein
MPGGDSKTVDVTQTAPGRFTGSFTANEIGSYIVTVAEPDPQGGTRVRSSGFSVSYPAEYQSFKPNRPLLARMSAVTKGEALLKPQDALRPIQDPGASITELWALFVFLAGILLPFDVGVRRIALPLGEIIAKLLEKLRLYRRQRQVVAVGPVDRLRVAKQRAQTEYSPSTPMETAFRAPEPGASRERGKPAAGVGTGSAATAKQLLAAKRQRKTDE